MAFPVPQDRLSQAFPSAGGSHLVNMPATVNAGDLLVVGFESSGTATVTTPSGWTLIGQQLEGTALRLSVYAKDAVGNEGGTTVDFVTSSSQVGASVLYRITGWRDSAVLTDDVKIALLAAGWTSTPNPPLLDPAWGTEDILWVVMDGRNNTKTVSAYPTNYTNGFGITTDVDRASAAERQLAAASEDPGAFTLSGAANNAVATVAIRPAAAVGGGHIRRMMMGVG